MRRLVETLSRPAAVTRISTVLASGLGVAVLLRVRHSVPGVIGWWAPLLGVTLLVGFVRASLTRILPVVGRVLRLRRGRLVGLAGLALAGLALSWLAWQVGPGEPGAGGGLAAVLAAAILLVFGGWVCLLTHRRVRVAPQPVLRHLPDLLLAAFIGLDLNVLLSHDLLAAHAAAGLLLPVGGWAAVRTWRAMTGSRHLAVRAGADIVLSLLLGASLVLFLVWLANLLDLPRAEVVAVRGVLARIGSITDVPWWVWTVSYLLLAAASLVFAVRPSWLAAVPARLSRVPLLRSVDIGRRVLSSLHIGLLVTVLIAAVAPTAVAARLHGRLAAKYTVALQRQLQAEGAQAAYEEIRRQFTPTTGPVPVTTLPLADIVRKIHTISPPPRGTDEATSVARDLATRVGRIQATTLPLDAAPPVLSAPQATEAAARFEPPAPGTRELRDRLDQLDAQQRTADTAARQALRAAELAATAVASTIPKLDLGEHEVVQIIKEYLQGLVEGSRLKDAFYAWTKRLAGAPKPPRADQAVVPDPPRLRLAALAALIERLGKVRLAGPLFPNPVEPPTATESAAGAAVDLANKARYLDEGGTGPCDGCPRPLRPGEEPGLGPGEHEGPGGRPPEPPRIPIR
jgi:hypothetical protein